MRDTRPNRPIPQIGRRKRQEAPKGEFLDILDETNSTPLWQRLLTRIKPYPLMAYRAWLRLLETHRRDVMIVGFGLIALIIVHAQRDTSSFTISKTTTGASTTSRQGAKLQKGTPDFKTLLPKGKDAKDVGEWTRVSPPDSNAVYAYNDTLSGVSINVSQQPLPKDFKTDTAEHVRTLATDFGAQKHFTLHGSDIYIGTSVKGPQSVIFTKNKLLILIKSTEKISDDSWASYIENLN